MTSNVGVNKPSEGGNRSSSSRRLPSKRTRQVSSLHQMIPTVDEGDNEDDEKTAETTPDNISISASEASSKASSSQPQLLDFIGATCTASAWFTSCFPCAVVDINDTDDYVVDKLSRESAMNVMYANNNNNHNTVPVSPSNSLQHTSTPQSTPEREQNNVMYVQLSSSYSGDNNGGPTSIHSIPSVIEEDSNEEEDDEEDAMDEISLNSPQATTTKKHGDHLGISMPVLTTNDIVEEGGATTFSPPKKKRFGMKKFFGKKKT